MEIKPIKFVYDPLYGCFDVIEETMLNYTDKDNLNNNKVYKVEIWVNEDNKYRVHIIESKSAEMGSKKYIVLCKSKERAYKVYSKLIEEKINNRYIDISNETTNVYNLKAQLSSKFIKNKVFVDESFNPGRVCKLHRKIQNLIKIWSDNAAEFILSYLDVTKCPLAKITSEQIEVGKNLLEQLSYETDPISINKLTGLYYSNIPYIFPAETTVNMIRINNQQKINDHANILDILDNTKDYGNVLFKNSIKLLYMVLKSEIQYLEEDDKICVWIRKLFGKNPNLKIENIFAIKRNNEEDNFISSFDEIRKGCFPEFIPPELKDLIFTRPDIKDIDLYKSANVIPLWYSLKNENIFGEISKGLLLKQGKFGNGLYFNTNAANQSDYLFICDVIAGNVMVVEEEEQFSAESIKPYNSVYVKNSNQLITYTGTGKNQQHYIRYVVEVKKIDVPQKKPCAPKNL